MKWEITSIQLNSEIPQPICIWFSSAELRKTDDLFRSFALTGFCESLNFCFHSQYKQISEKIALQFTPPNLASKNFRKLGMLVPKCYKLYSKIEFMLTGFGILWRLIVLPTIMKAGTGLNRRQLQAFSPSAKPPYPTTFPCFELRDWATQRHGNARYK